jgi:hypothetical protein
MHGEVYGIARAGTVVESGSDSQTNAPASYVTDFMDGGGLDPSSIIFIVSADSSKVSGPACTQATLSSYLDVAVSTIVNSGSYYADAWNHDVFDITIGSSAEYPVGTPLTLECGLDFWQVSGDYWADTPAWSLNIGGLVIDNAHPSALLAVTAGGVVHDVSFSHRGQTVEYAQAEGPPTRSSEEVSNMTILMSVTVPEPGTLALLFSGIGFAAAAAWSRRRR